MPYGLNVKPVHGYYVEVEALDGAIDQVKLSDETPDDGYPARSQPLTAGRSVQTQNLPTRLRWKDRQGHPIPDFDNGLILNVSSRAKDLIDEFEPGTHQFVPVSYENSAGQHLERRYFLFVGNRIDAMHPDNPTMALNRGMYWVPLNDLLRRGQELPPGKNADLPAKLVLSRERIGQVHLWIDKRLASGATFMSDKLAEAVRDKGLTGIRPGGGRNLVTHAFRP
ncbi:imm11 family protein [Sphingomonas sp. LHG3443-2]|uniref:imm11 family protein n=1 Tax=Sphingomonas sp. LHG3443-2 TaxID=2804639 RepID=UPI003CF9030B